MSSPIAHRHSPSPLLWDSEPSLVSAEDPFDLARRLPDLDELFTAYSGEAACTAARVLQGNDPVDLTNPPSRESSTALGIVETLASDAVGAAAISDTPHQRLFAFPSLPGLEASLASAAAKTVGAAARVLKNNDPSLLFKSMQDQLQHMRQNPQGTLNREGQINRIVFWNGIVTNACSSFFGSAVSRLGSKFNRLVTEENSTALEIQEELKSFGRTTPGATQSDGLERCLGVTQATRLRQPVNYLLLFQAMREQLQHMRDHPEGALKQRGNLNMKTFWYGIVGYPNSDFSGRSPKDLAKVFNSLVTQGNSTALEIDKGLKSFARTPPRVREIARRIA